MNSHITDKEQWLSEFLYTLSHDLSGPARNTQGFCELLSRHVKTIDDPKLEKYATLATQEAQRMNAMLLGALELSRIHSSHSESIEVALKKRVQNVWDDIIAPHYPDATLQCAIGSETLSMQSEHADILLRHLLENACLHNETTPEVHVGLTQKNGMQQLTVRDNGIGLDEAYFHDACMLYARAKPNAHPTHHGIGLALVHAIAERYNLVLSCKSSDKGTEISVLG